MSWEPSPLIVDGSREWVSWVAALPSDWTTDGERFVLLTLACDAFRNESAPGADNLAAWTGMNRRSVQRILGRLIEPTSMRPALLVKANDSKGRAASRYRFQPPLTDTVDQALTAAQPPPKPQPTDTVNRCTTSAQTATNGHPPFPSPLNTPSLSSEQRAVANALGLQDDDERLTSVDQMLKDNSAKKPLAFIAHCAKNGSLTDLLTEAHGGTWAKQMKTAEADRRRCPHGVINGKSAGQCVKCTEDTFAMPA